NNYLTIMPAKHQIIYLLDNKKYKISLILNQLNFQNLLQNLHLYNIQFLFIFQFKSYWYLGHQVSSFKNSNYQNYYNFTPWLR
ncbi:hypothetical protein ABPG73_008253, partial [Tetrahymena malaccensis]